jgi:hypothetical protein
MEFEIGIGEEKWRGKATTKTRTTHSWDVLEDFTASTSDEKNLRGNILVTSDPRHGVKHSLGRFLPKQPRQMGRRTLDVHSALLIATLSPRRRLLVALLRSQRHPLQHLPSLNQSNVGGACSVYSRQGYLTVAGE